LHRVPAIWAKLLFTGFAPRPWQSDEEPGLAWRPVLQLDHTCWSEEASSYQSLNPIWVIGFTTPSYKATSIVPCSLGPQWIPNKIQSDGLCMGGILANGRRQDIYLPSCREPKLKYRYSLDMAYYINFL
jgi:hypothetical protein